jgi:hypothetical protein
MASPDKGIDPISLRGIDELIKARMQSELRFYDSLAHQSIFSLPKHVRIRLASEERIIEDNAPLFTYH